MGVYEILRRVAKEGSLILLIALVIGCNFDAGYQYDLRFPASLIIKNETKGTVVVDSVLSSPEAESTFVLKGRSMGPGEFLKFRIAATDYKVILAGAFVLRGSCGGKQPWEVPGRKLTRNGVYDAQRWDVTVTISTCDP